MNFVAWSLSVVFLSIATLHLYWAGGGMWAAQAAAPKHQDGRAVFQPGAVACVTVASGLLAFAYACLAHRGLVPPLFLAGRTRWVLLAMSAIFAWRTIGDFKFAGLFRRVQSTDFGRLDRLVYTPLCGAVSALLGWLATGG